MIRSLTLSALLLLPASAVFAGPVPPADAAWAQEPRGEGDPAAVTCRVPQALPGLRMKGPAVCQTNRVWKALATYRDAILPDGRRLASMGLQSEACGSERVAGVTAMIDTGAARTFYRCNP